MTTTVTIGGVPRSLSLAPSRRRVGAVKPDVSLADLPMRVEWPLAFPRDYDQLSLSACGPNALAEQYEYRTGVKFSRLFSYYWTRAAERDTADDGVTIVDLLDVAHTLGMPAEILWPYDPAKYDTAPPTLACVDAQAHRVLVQDSVADLDHLLFEIANGQPVLCGIGLPASIEDGRGDTATTGLVAVPSETDPLIGRHAVNTVAFNRSTGRVQCTSHWGNDYGDRGTLWLPFAHWLSGNVSDMRAVRKIGAA